MISLGGYAERLSPFSLLLFPLGVQLSLGRDRCGGRYLTRALMTKLLGIGAGEFLDRRERLPRHLILLGIVDRNDSGRYLVSQPGRQLLTAAQECEAELRDLFQLILESEIHGFMLREPTVGADDGVGIALSANSQSLSEAARLTKAGRHLEAHRLLYPSIEAHLNSLIEKEGLSARRLGGLHKMFEELIRAGRVSPRLGHWGEVVVSRNKIVHGDIRDGADDLCVPLYPFVSQFLVELIQDTQQKCGAAYARDRPTAPRRHSDPTSRGS